MEALLVLGITLAVLFVVFLAVAFLAVVIADPGEINVYLEDTDIGA